MLRISQPNFQHYVKKIEAQAKKSFLIKEKKRVILESIKKDKWGSDFFQQSRHLLDRGGVRILLNI